MESMDGSIDPSMTLLTYPEGSHTAEGNTFYDLESCLPTPVTKAYVQNDKSPLTSAFSRQTEDYTVGSSFMITNPSVPMAKISTRFTTDIVRVLKSWLDVNKTRPYPNEKAVSMLMAQTGLNKVQVLNWFANARRRGRVQHSTPDSSSQAISMPIQAAEPIARPGTPAPRRDASMMKPLERWVESPPENEAASVSDITRAIGSTSWMAIRTSAPNCFCSY